MRRAEALCGLAVAATAALALAAGDPSVPRWPGFRGPQASGQGTGEPPIEWDVPSGEGVAWKTQIPGLAHSSPAIWGDRLFVTTAVSEGGNDDLKVGLYGDVAPVDDDSVHSYRIYALDRTSGEILWEREAHRGVPAVKRHTKSTHANPTPATDGERVVAFFGSEGLYAYDLEGELLWRKDLGVLDAGFFMAKSAQWGFSSSPVLVDGRVIVQCDVQEGSFVAAFDAATGEEIWRTPRGDVPTFGTPTVYEVDGDDGRRKVVAVNGWRHIGAYDFDTGEEVWRFRGGGDIPTPTPIVAHGYVYITNAHGNLAPICAVKLGARGAIDLADGRTSSDGIAWCQFRDGAYMQTPIVVGDHLYVCRDNGVLGCYRAETGEEVYRERLGKGGTSGFTASAVAANGYLYYTNETGEVFVVRAGPEFELVATNQTGETVMATPAIVDGVIYFRTRAHVVAVGGA
jgi:outer membrane protein assembly factor BamB